MKRKLSFLLALIMCFSTFSSFAAEISITQDEFINPSTSSFDQNYQKTFVSYEDIYDLVLNNNKTIASNNLALKVIQTPPGVAEGLDALWTASQGLASVINMVNSAMLGIDTSLDNPNLYNDYNLYVALAAGKTALQLSKSDIDAQMEALNPTTDEDMESTIKQFDFIAEQLIWGAQSLYMAYINLDLSIKELEITKQSLENTISSLEKRYELGQIAHIDLLNVKASLISLESAMSSIKYEQQKLLYDLNILLGRNLNSTIHLSQDITPDIDYLSTIDVDNDFLSVLENNYTYYTLTEAVSDAKSTHRELKTTASQNNYDMAVLNQEIEEQSMLSSFTKIYKSLDEKQRLLDVELQILENNQLNLSINQIKYDLGKISLDTLTASELECLTQELKVTAAKYNLFVAIEQYKWATNGMITG